MFFHVGKGIAHYVHFWWHSYIHNRVCTRSQECVKQDSFKEMLHGVQRDRQPCCLLAAAAFDAVMGIFLFLALPLSVAVADVASELWSNCAFIPPLSLSFSLSLISWRVSAAGCPRFTDHLPPSHLVQRLFPLLCGALLTPSGQENGSATEKYKEGLFGGLKCGILRYILFYKLSGVDLVWPCGKL